MPQRYNGAQLESIISLRFCMALTKKIKLIVPSSPILVLTARICENYFHSSLRKTQISLDSQLKTVLAFANYR